MSNQQQDGLAERMLAKSDSVSTAAKKCGVPITSIMRALGNMGISKDHADKIRRVYGQDLIFDYIRGSNY